MKFSGFRLLELETYNNHYLGRTKIVFTEDTSFKEYPYITTLIGPNGSGKSYLLRTIIDIFREINYSIKHDGKSSNIVRGSFYIKFENKGDVYEFGNLKKAKIQRKEAILVEPKMKRTKFPFQIIKNNIQVSFDKIKKDDIFPGKILAQSMMLTDRFPIIKRDEDFGNYKYLGIRRLKTPSVAGTKTFIRRTVDYIVESFLNDPSFTEKLKMILSFINYSTTLTISYYPRYANKFYKENLTIEDFKNAFDNWEDSFNRKSKPWGLDHYESIKSDKILISKIVHKLKDLALLFKEQGAKEINYDIFENDRLFQDYELIQELDKLDLIVYPTLKLKKESNYLAFGSISSGEMNIITSLISIAATINKNSLVLIDEPENSLHPNWQMAYFKLLRDMFKGSSDSHFIVGTHSHLLLSNLLPDNSTIVSLNREKSVLSKLYDFEIYGWSSEEILYEIFKVRSTRNYFFEYDISNLLSLINHSSKDFETIRKLIEKISKYKLSENDPLVTLIDKAKNYLEKHA